MKPQKERCVDCGQEMEEEVIYENKKIGTLIRLTCSCGFMSSKQKGYWQAKHLATVNTDNLRNYYGNNGHQNMIEIEMKERAKQEEKYAKTM